MSAAHTTGPWQFYADLPSTEPNWHIVTNSSRLRVVANVHIEPGNEADLANARLIAAAPELLEALEDVLGEWVRDLNDTGDEDVEERAYVKFARAAIARATGSTTGMHEFGELEGSRHG